MKSSAGSMLLLVGSVSACAESHSVPSFDVPSAQEGGVVEAGPVIDAGLDAEIEADGSGPGSFGDAGLVSGCPFGTTCNASCPESGTTSISGRVYDPAGKNPLYNVAVYVPPVPLQPLPKGVPTGADACSCGALYKSGAVTSTSTGVDGRFTLTNVPVGSSVPLVLQVGKWRRLLHVGVTACMDNAQPDGSLALPSTVPPGDTDDNIPDIAVSTGFADSLECLMLRIGLPADEYVAGAGGPGHVHVFAGGTSSTTLGSLLGVGETPGMAGAPPSYTDLWSTQAQLMAYDAVLLSCEGGETFQANPPALEAYLDAGGRVFASHYHYSWFAGPLGSGQSYAAPADWGSNLASWSTAFAQAPIGNPPIGSVVDQTLNGSASPFPKGVALFQWLGTVGALGTYQAPPNELAIYQPRYNAEVGPSNTPSQPWITSDSSSTLPGATMYFSFDTPVQASATAADGGASDGAADGGARTYCGRVVFSDLHVGGITIDGTQPPGTCKQTALSPQEKALEFMLFDLSSCVIPDTTAPDAGIPQ
jgi:hypothetical protein